MTGAVDVLYREIILDHYRMPRNKRRAVEPSVVVRHENPLCGDELDVAVCLEGDVISDASFDGRGCAIAQASASMMTGAVRGATVHDALALVRRVEATVSGEDVDLPGELAALSAVAMFPVRAACARLAWGALAEGLNPMRPTRS